MSARRNTSGRAAALLLGGLGGGLIGGLLSGCGFHLAGDRPLPVPLRSIYITVVQPYGVTEPPVQEKLQDRIQRRGGAVHSNLVDADSELRISHLQENQEVIALGPDGKVLEYRLVTQLDYELIGKGRALVPPDHLVVTRDYNFNASQILAEEEEQARLRKYLQGEIAELLLLRLETRLSHPAPSG
jgi:LPS-assembly lipoprotein